MRFGFHLFMIDPAGFLDIAEIVQERCAYGWMQNGPAPALREPAR